MHPRTDFHRLYIPTKARGHDLLNVKQINAVESEGLAHYVLTKKFSGQLLFAIQSCKLFLKPLNSLAVFKSKLLYVVETKAIILITATQDQANVNALTTVMILCAGCTTYIMNWYAKN